MNSTRGEAEQAEEIAALLDMRGAARREGTVDSEELTITAAAGRAERVGPRRGVRSRVSTPRIALRLFSTVWIDSLFAATTLAKV